MQEYYFSTVTPCRKSPNLAQYLEDHGGVGRGELLHNLAIAILHHGLVFTGAQHKLLPTAALLRGRGAAGLALLPTQTLALHVPQQRRQS